MCCNLEDLNYFLFHHHSYRLQKTFYIKQFDYKLLWIQFNDYCTSKKKDKEKDLKVNKVV